MTDRWNVPLIIDDRVDVAIACDAAGVHVGASDLPVAVCRKLLGPDKIVGATAKTVEAAQAAYADGADYLAQVRFIRPQRTLRPNSRRSPRWMKFAARCRFQWLQSVV